MDAHFSEYLAAVVGMQDLYGHPAEDHPTDFHDECLATPQAASATDPVRGVAAASVLTRF